jgi:hypothetical protein
LFDGVQYRPGTGDYHVRGAKALIEIRSADLCTSEGSTFSGAWSMVASADAHGWAQIGYLNRSTSPTLTYFWQWMKDTTASTPRTATALFGSPAEGDSKTFRVEYLQSDDALHLFYGPDEGPCNSGGDCPTTPFDPLNAWNGTQGQWYGETGFAGSDVPGRSTSKTDFDTVRVKEPGTDWTQENWTATGSDKCFYKQDIINNGDHFKIWTQPIDHDC